MDYLARAEADFHAIAQAIAFVHANRRPTPEQLAAALKLSSRALQELLARWAALTPERFLRLASMDFIAQTLRNPATPLPRPQISNDQLITLKESDGSALHIKFGLAPSPFGLCLIGLSAGNICFLEFVHDTQPGNLKMMLNHAWPGAALQEAQEAAQALADRIFLPADRRPEPLNILTRGSSFQTSIWQVLLKTRSGHLFSYAQIARQAGKAEAFRAAGRAVGANRIAWLVPCHRVISSNGAAGGYRWGTPRKIAALIWEQAHLGAPS